MDEKKYQIFVSSTYTDLKKEREAVIKTILCLYHIPIGMEMFNAGDDDQWSVIKRTIETSDYYVVIIGERYGSTMDSGVSYTEMEYDYAVSQDIPVMAFIKEGDGFKPSSNSISEAMQYAEKQKLISFREKAKMKYADFWRTKGDLTTKLSTSLHKMFIARPRIGWIHAKRTQHIDTLISDGYTVAIVLEYGSLKQNNTVPYHGYKVRNLFGLGHDDSSQKPYWLMHLANSRIHLTANEKLKFKSNDLIEDVDGFNGDRAFIVSDLWAVDVKM